MKRASGAKVYTLETALERVRNYCAYQERSHQEVRDKLYTLGMTPPEVEQGIAVLIEEGFINEERFALAWAGGKFRIKRWGRVKIKAGLRAKKISDYCIRKALESIPEEDYQQALEETVKTGLKRAAVKREPLKSRMAARYAISRGYEADLVQDCLKN